MPFLIHVLNFWDPLCGALENMNDSTSDGAKEDRSNDLIHNFFDSIKNDALDWVIDVT